MILFIRDRNVLEVIEDTLGMDIIIDMINYKDSMKSETYKCIYKFLRNTKLKDEEFRVIKKTKYNDEIVKKITSKLTHFSYPEKEYKYFLNMKVNIKPSFDATKCRFTIKPALSKGLSLNKSNGVISGVCEKIESNEYTIKCKCLNNYEDRKNYLKYKIKIEILPLSFSATNKNKEISLKNPLVAFKDTDSPNIYNHCYIDIKMEKGIYKISYRSLTKDSIMLGASLSESFSGNQLYKQNSYSIYICDSDCKLFGENGYVHKDIPIRNKVQANFTMIYDMDKCTISIVDDSEKQYPLFHDIKKPLYPFVDILEICSSVQLMNLEIL